MKHEKINKRLAKLNYLCHVVNPYRKDISNKDLNLLKEFKLDKSKKNASELNIELQTLLKITHKDLEMSKYLD